MARLGNAVAWGREGVEAKATVVGVIRGCGTTWGPGWGQEPGAGRRPSPKVPSFYGVGGRGGHSGHIQAGALPNLHGSTMYLRSLGEKFRLKLIFPTTNHCS